MQRFLASVIATTLIASAPIHAQEAPAPLKDCRALLKAARGEIERTTQTEIEYLEDGCRFTHVGLAIDSSITADMDELIIRTPDLLAVWPTGDVFESADLTLNGFALLPGQNFNLQLVYDTDPDAMTANLERLHLDAGALGEFTLAANFSEFDNADLEASPLESEKGLLHKFELSLVDTGLSAVLLPSLMLIIGSPTAEDTTAIATTIRSWPESRISKKSAKSLVRLLTALPNLSGNWTLQFESEEGLAINTLVAGSFDAFADAIPDDAKIEATAAKR
ncbi:hypothetical protein ASG47_06760 [Devosia sp. Leaf420]|uniref:hypothetical protein n=1 Tax=Devosia sp. Leaf420 TaxID=1736374 RepID=UPI00071271E4|nr:hypothetical protein [Devosia sp. Leaf420]KQT48077.1 hypothetical protein ASG47_06760 [Devosia sp. Leaf420]